MPCDDTTRRLSDIDTFNISMPARVMTSIGANASIVSKPSASRSSVFMVSDFFANIIHNSCELLISLFGYET